MSDPTPQIVRRALALCRAAEPHQIDGSASPLSPAGCWSRSPGPIDEPPGEPTSSPAAIRERESLMGTEVSNTAVDPTLAQLEDRIAEGVTAAGEALDEIHARRLYLPAFASFDDYCRERWGMTKRTAFRKIEQAAATKALPPGAAVPSQREVAREKQSDSSTYPKRDARAPSSNAPRVKSRSVAQRPLDTIQPDAVLAPSAPREAATNGSAAPTQPDPVPAVLAAPAPTLKAQIAHLHDHLADLSPPDLWEGQTESQRAVLTDYINELRRAKAAAPSTRREPAMAGTRSQGSITRPADRSPSAASAATPVLNGECSHPKDREQNKGYAVICGLCKARLR